MYLDGLDNIDRKIVSLLTENSRMSYVDIAKEVNLSRVAVKARIEALEESGVIDHITGKNKLHVHTLAAGHKEMDDFLDNVMYKLPGITNFSCDIIVSRVKDIIGLKL